MKRAQTARVCNKLLTFFSLLLPINPKYNGTTTVAAAVAVAEAASGACKQGMARRKRVREREGERTALFCTYFAGRALRSERARKSGRAV